MIPPFLRPLPRKFTRVRRQGRCFPYPRIGQLVYSTMSLFVCKAILKISPRNPPVAGRAGKIPLGFARRDFRAGWPHLGCIPRLSCHPAGGKFSAPHPLVSPAGSGPAPRWGASRTDRSGNVDRFAAERHRRSLTPSRTVKVRTISYLPYGRGQGVGLIKSAPLVRWGRSPAQRLATRKRAGALFTALRAGMTMLLPSSLAAAPLLRSRDAVSRSASFL